MKLERVFNVLADEISNILVVDLQIGGTNEILLGRVAGDRLEDVLERARYHALLGGRALHGKRLAASGLTVGEHRAVVALAHALDQSETEIVVELFRVRLDAVRAVECELFRWRVGWLFGTCKAYLISLRVDIYNYLFGFVFSF